MEKDDLIIGRQPVLEALKAGLNLKRVILARGITGPVIQEIERSARVQGLPLEKRERREIDALVPGHNHQGVAALGFEFQYGQLEDIFDRAGERGEMPFLVLLDHILDPQNLGALIRSAEGVGAHGIVIPSRRCAPVTAAVYKASAGAVSHLPVARVKNLNYLVDKLKKQGLWVYGSDVRGLQDYHEVDYRNPLALVIGSEEKGISRLLKEKCDYLVKIPMKGRVNSLNASAAGAILMYEILRQREV